MNNIKSLPLTIIISSLFFLFVICIQISIFFLDYQLDQQKLYDEKQQNIKVIADNLQTRLSNSLMRLENAQAQNTVSETALNNNLKQVAVIDHNHQILLSNHFRDKYMSAIQRLPQYDSTKFDTVIKKSKFIFQYDQTSQNITAYVPLQMLSRGNSINRNFNGLIFIRYSAASDLEELQYHTLIELIKMTSVLVISLIFLIYLLNYFIIKPIHKLTRSSSLSNVLNENDVQQGGYGEVAALQFALNDLSKQCFNRFDKLSQSEQRLLYALSGSRDGIWDWDIANNIVHFSDRWKELIGYEKAELADTIEEWESLIHKDDVFLFASELSQHFSGKKSFFEITYRIRCRNGDYSWMLSRGQTVSWDESGLPLRIIGTSTDVANYKQLQPNQDYYAHFDAVTQLPNRSQLLLNIEKECARSKRSHLFGAIIFIDCNQYKMINHLHGHYQGEELLFDIARRIEEFKDESYLIAHLTGSEFGVLLPDLHHKRESAADIAYNFADTLNKSLKIPFVVDAEEITLSCAFGIELFPLLNCTANDLLRQASIALKFSEENLFSNIFFFSKEIEDNINERQSMQKQIDYGLENDEFSLNFQARVDIHGNLIGAEVLSRWKHSKKGWITPTKFISVAEDSRLIFRLGDWVVQSSFEQLAKWESVGLPNTFTALSVNVSPIQFLQVDFIDSIKHHLAVTKVNPKLIEIEITENVLVKHKQLVIEKINTLRELGIRFAIDDFGTDYSSFSYLSILPVSTLKIDQSFIKNLMQNDNQQVIVSSIISMAKALKLDVVAEGVESEEQLNFLIEKGCTQFQGYLVGTPMTQQEFQHFLFDT